MLNRIFALSLQKLKYTWYMLVKTQTVVLRTIKYGENKLIVDFLTAIMAAHHIQASRTTLHVVVL